MTTTMILRPRAIVARAQRGAALLVGLIFLVVLSLVAVLAMKGTLMEMRMVNNVAAHEQAFEVSETGRLVVAKMFTEHFQQGGWPIALMGGTVTDTLFSTYPSSCTSGSTKVGSNGVSCQMVTAMAVRKSGSTPVNLYDISLTGSEKIYDPSTWMTTTPDGDVKISLCSTGQTSTCTADTFIRVWVRPDGSGIPPGYAANANGGGAKGSSVSAGSAFNVYEIVSDGRSPGNGRVVTQSQFQVSVAP